MNFTQETNEDGVTERCFELQVAGELVPGVVWLPQGGRTARPLLLMGHGGGQSKMFAPFAAFARHCARELGYAVVAIDAPGHGARVATQHGAPAAPATGRQMALGQPPGAQALATFAECALMAVPEWRAVIDAMQTLDFIGASDAVGYLGLSLGSMTGIALAAADPRIKAAVFGLVGLREESAFLEPAARALSVPIEFVVQWDDELVARSDALALYDAFGSAQKTLHANPGGHGGVPPFERLGWLPFLLRHLGQVESPH